MQQRSNVLHILSLEIWQCSSPLNITSMAAYKSIILGEDGSFRFRLGKDIDLDYMSLERRYSSAMLGELIRILSEWKICTGKQRPHLVTVSSNYTDTYMVNPRKWKQWVSNEDRTMSECCNNAKFYFMLSCLSENAHVWTPAAHWAEWIR